MQTSARRLKIDKNSNSLVVHGGAIRFEEAKRQQVSEILWIRNKFGQIQTRTRLWFKFTSVLVWPKTLVRFPSHESCSLVKSRSRLARVGTTLFTTRRVGVFWYETSLDQLNIVRYPSNYCHIYIHHPHTDTIILPFPPHHPFAANRTNPCPSRSIFLTLFRSMFTPGQKCLRWQKPGARLQTLECMRRAKANSSTPLRLMPFVHLDIK